MSEERLSRIEGKVDGLVAAMMKLIRIEEKQNSVDALLKRYGFRLDDIERRVEAIEKVMPLLDVLLKVTGKIGIIIITTITISILGMVFIA